MSKGPALALVGIGILALTAVAKAGSKTIEPFIPSEDDAGLPPQVPDEAIEDPDTVDPDNEEPGEPAEPAGPTPGPGNGSVPMVDLLPEPLKNIDLSGKESWSYGGEQTIGAGGKWHVWRVDDSLNGMPITIAVSVQHPEDWIAFFTHYDPPGSVPPTHSIVYKISPDSSHQHRKFMLKEIAGLNE